MTHQFRAPPYPAVGIAAGSDGQNDLLLRPDSALWGRACDSRGARGPSRMTQVISISRSISESLLKSDGDRLKTHSQFVSSVTAA